MTLCKDCVVDMICTQQCPMFEIDIKRLHSDNFLYLKRCMNNIKFESCYKISKNIKVKISSGFICWVKNGQRHRDNDHPAIIYYDGTRYWYKNGQCHRDNDKPAIIVDERTQQWFKNGVEYEPM